MSLCVWYWYWLWRSTGWNVSYSGDLLQCSCASFSSGHRTLAVPSRRGVSVPWGQSRLAAPHLFTHCRRCARLYIATSYCPKSHRVSTIEINFLIFCGSLDCGSSAWGSPTIPLNPQVVLSARKSTLVGRTPALRLAASAPVYLSEGGTVRATACPGPAPSASADGCPDSARLRVWLMCRRCSHQVGSALWTCSRRRWRRAGTAEVYMLKVSLYVYFKGLYLLQK